MPKTKRPRALRASSRGEHTADVIVVGAGVAGLAAAARLAEARKNVVVLEARDRIGGRILTEPAADLAAAIELGAEFLHGDADPIGEIADQHRLGIVHVPDHRFRPSGKRLVPFSDTWGHIDRAWRALDANRNPDRSFADALAARGARLSTTDRALATQFVEGYDAADAARVSERWLADGGAPCDDMRELRTRRLLGGYGVLVDALAAPIRARIRTGAIVSAIRWQRGRVEVETRSAAGVAHAPLVARAVVVTVPIGVLAAAPGAVGAIAFEPPIPAMERAVALATMGAVVKLVLRFRDAFWLERRFCDAHQQASLDALSFIQSTQRRPVSVWWTSNPIRSPLLVAWSGGPSALTIAGHSHDELTTLALDSLATIFAMRASTLRARLVGSFYHDWLGDPFARGAYSYALVGGHRMSERLARPIEHTIWLAGEAADKEGRTGTVHGAIASGYRAAREILATSSRSSSSKR